MKSWLKFGWTASLALLAACSSLQSPVESTLGTQATGSVTKRVAASTDDAEETPELGGRVTLDGNDLELGYGDDTRPQSVGLRFTGITIPPGAEITSARIEFTARATSSGSASLTFYGVDEDNASTFSTAAYNVSGRTKTSASAAWSAPAWTQSEVGADTTTPDLKAVVQEVVNRPNWASGNALAIVVSGTGTGQRSAWAADFGSSTAPELVVNYSTTEAPPPPPPPPPPEDPTNPEIATWQARLESYLNSTSTTSGRDFDPKAMAATGNTYRLARMLNESLTALTAAYRVNKDPDTARYIRDVMAIAKSKLKDAHKECPSSSGSPTNCSPEVKASQPNTVDGFLNFVYDHRGDSSDIPFVYTDRHVMDEILAHSSFAGAAYTLRQAGYTADAAFWTDYLKNDFEAKWRKRNNKPSGFPFMSKLLIHPYIHFIRYHYYMYKLTGDSAYYTEAQRTANVVERNMRPISTAGGTGYVWDHAVVESGTIKTGCHPTTYLAYSMGGLQDLHVMDPNLFDSTFMRKVANTFAYEVLAYPNAANGRILADDVCGNGVRENNWVFAKGSYGLIAPWDASGKVEAALRKAYTDFTQTENFNTGITTSMILSLGR